MTAPVEIGRLRVRPGALRVGASGTRSGGLGRDVVARLRAEALLDGLGPAPGSVPERGVLVIRRARWPADETFTARARADLDARRRTARRPALTPDRGVHEDAVVFVDEVELLACLTRDAVSGQLSRWYWRRLVPTTAAGAGPVLAAAWTARARWLPPVLATLPTSVVERAVDALTDPEAARVTQALLVAFDIEAAAGVDDRARTGDVDSEGAGGRSGGAEPTVPAGSGSPRASRTVASAVEASPGRLLVQWARALVVHPDEARRDGISRLTASASAVGAGADPSEGASPARDAHAGVAEEARTSVVGAGPTVHSADGTAAGWATRGGPDVAVTRTWRPVADADVEADAGTDAAGDDASESPASPQSFAGAVPSACASVLYLVNVVRWLELPGGWSAVERLARLVLAPALADPSRAADLVVDPIWAVLHDLAGAGQETAGTGAEAGTSGPSFPTTAVERMWTWFETQHVTTDVFTHPGLVAVTRTHVDVVLDLDRVDLVARVSGLDRDPGWVPDLGRIITFHFVGGHVHRPGPAR